MTRTEADLSAYLGPVQEIIEAVRTEGDAAVARFGREFDKADVHADRLMATPEEFDAGVRHDRARGARGDRVRRGKHPGVPRGAKARGDVAEGDPARRVRGRAHDADPVGRLLRAARQGRLPLGHDDDHDPGGDRGRAGDRRADAADAGRRHRCGEPGRGAHGGRRAGLPLRRRVAVAAAAFGTRAIPRCVKIVGPGSPWVVAAKKLLADRIDTGLPAGPSESIVLADGSANGRIAALDLLVEAEHGPDSSAFLVTDSRAVAEAARAAIPGYWQRMGAERVGYTKAVLGGPRGGIVLAADMDQAIAFANDYAPEHLEVLSDEPLQYLGRLQHAGEILLGENSVLTLGNYLIGPNCVLPTGGHARSWSPLSVHDFMKRTSIAQVTRAGYRTLAPYAHTLATYEGFDAHANAVSPLRDKTA